MLVLIPGGAQLDSILGKIHPEGLAFSESLFFIAASCDMTTFESEDRVDLALIRRPHVVGFCSQRLEGKAIWPIKTRVIGFGDTNASWGAGIISNEEPLLLYRTS